MASKLTQMQLDFIESLFGEANGDIKLAKKLALYPANASMDVILANGARETIIERAKNELAAGAAKAVFGLRDLIDEPTTPGSKVKLAALSQLLDRANITKDEKITIDTNGALFILPSKDSSNEVSIP